ncbi:uncharacterized protein LOC125590576 [Brassica napus]|uniref:uncharacterized protein LOC125590576 n=1 Tax=Brassica napus TaxID=3708 RepID=UPI002079F9BE|nr:uncharacterized protein LOC125590576 [Brassica napus]
MSSSSSDEVDEALEEMVDQVVDNFIDSVIHAHPNKQKRRVKRDREQGHNRLWNDYFKENPTYPPEMFRRRFRMNKPLFLHIVERYLRRPTPEDLQRLLDVGEVRGFPGMVGSIDCMHWEWKNCPTAWKDINVLDRSPVFDDILQGRAPKVKFKVNNHTYRMAYYLTDGIYPNWSTFVQSIPLPQGPKAEKFAKKQESARKDVEWAFGVLQSRFAIVKHPALLWDKEKIGNIMKTCVILHNMIVENERHRYAQINTSEFESGESSRSSRVTRRDSIHVGDMLAMRREVRDQDKDARLKADLMENI